MMQAAEALNSYPHVRRPLPLPISFCPLSPQAPNKGTCRWQEKLLKRLIVSVCKIIEGMARDWGGCSHKLVDALLIVQNWGSICWELPHRAAVSFFESLYRQSTHHFRTLPLTTSLLPLIFSLRKELLTDIFNALKQWRERQRSRFPER